MKIWKYHYRKIQNIDEKLFIKLKTSKIYFILFINLKFIKNLFIKSLTIYICNLDEIKRMWRSQNYLALSLLFNGKFQLLV